MQRYVYSTATSSQKYVTYHIPEDKNLAPTEVYSVLIKGGANLADKHLITPRGVVTKITDEDYEHLMKNAEFLKHMKNGFMTVRDDQVDPEVAVAAGMQQADRSAPYTPNSPEFNKPDEIGKDGGGILGLKPREAA